MNSKKSYTAPDEHGYYGQFGGAFIPEMLYRNVEELLSKYLELIYDIDFQKELNLLLHDYAGRPTPLYFAERLSNQYNANIYLKREDLCHTGAHKINNTIGQLLLAQRMGKKRIIAETGAGQHGVATATVCALKGIECIVYMGEKDMQRQAPNATNDVKTGGKFSTTMAAKDGSFSFEFGGDYIEVKENDLIVATMNDGRMWKTLFKENGNTTTVIERFEAEAMNSLELQQGGWQSILNNFKKYTETI